MNDFLFISHDVTSPEFNIASEEYLLKQKGGYYVYIWRNEPAVIVGVNQNTIREVNLKYTNDNKIKVVRRLTGGGAVYHDLNNICYTIIAPYKREENAFIKWTRPIIDFLRSLGINAEFSGRNDITIDGKKISGNAQTVYKDRVMHHGTLLFDTSLNVLTDALKENKLKIESKGIKSVRARVTNIKSYLNKDFTCEKFMKLLISYLKKSYKEYVFSQEDLENINKLSHEKYSSYSWNVGESPKCTNTFTYKFSFGILTIDFDLIKGKIENPKITGDFFSIRPIEELEEKLCGINFTYESIKKALIDADKYILNANGEEIADRFYS